MGTIKQKVALEEVRFFSLIGFYDEEIILGNEFFVSVDVSFPYDNPDAELLGNTINYEILYTILADCMRPERRLLESAAADILERILQEFTFVEEVNVRIRKANPPFGGDSANAVVSLHYVV